MATTTAAAKRDRLYEVTCGTCGDSRLVGAEQRRVGWRSGYRCKGCSYVKNRTLPAGPCRHCGLRFGTHRHGLCWVCVRDARIRAQYMPTGSDKFLRRGWGNLGCGAKPLPPTPTAELPGTPGKLAVMEARAAAGWAVFHPLDAVRGEG